MQPDDQPLASINPTAGIAGLLRPTSIMRQFFSHETINAHLEAFAAAQQEDGGWLVWTPITGLEWRALATIEALTTLRAYGRFS